MRRVILLLLAGAIGTSGCSVLAPMPSPGTSAPPQDTGSAEAPAEQPGAPGSQATASLVAVGRSARESGDYEGAAAYFEQALRIAPNDPRLWIELGETRLAEGDAAQAEAMGRKALTLTGGDEGLESRARRLVDAN